MRALELASPASCNTPPTFIDSIRPNNQLEKKTKRPNFQQIVLYCLGLHTQKPGLRQVDLEPSPKGGSDKINMLKQGRNTQKKASRIIQPGLTYGSQHLKSILNIYSRPENCTCARAQSSYAKIWRLNLISVQRSNAMVLRKVLLHFVAMVIFRSTGAILQSN